MRSVCTSLMGLVFASPSLAEPGRLRERLTPEVMAVVYPGAEHLGMEEGSPPAIAVFKGDQIVAYLFSTLDIIAATGYSTIPFDVIAGVDLSGRITGAKVVFHDVSMIVYDTVRPAPARYAARARGQQAAARRYQRVAAGLCGRCNH